MTILASIKTALEADATLVAAATGGIYDYTETGRLGIGRTNTPSAYDSSGIIKPTILLRARALTPDFQLRDSNGKYSSARQTIEVYLYQDNSYTTIATMKDRVYALLHETQVTGTFLISWAGGSGEAFDYDINACVEREEYLVNTYRSV